MKSTLSKNWIQQFRKVPGQRKSRDPALIEKMIYAFYLLENLVTQNIDFVFKGGTSLVLITKESNRFSVDIDISSLVKREDLESALRNIVRDSEFEKFELDEKRSYENASLPKAHYKFTYNSELSKTKNIILLDIMFQENHYPETEELEINTEWLDTEKPFLKVKVPTINSILGDKLSAFAPNTTGVPYRVNKELEIIKQLYDVSILIEKATNYNVVDTSFKATTKSQIEYRNLQITTDDVLDDIFETAIIISKKEQNKGENLAKFIEIRNGLRSFTNFTINSNFRIEQAIEASAKAAWFAMKLKNQSFEQIDLYNASINLTDKAILNLEFSYLDRLKRSNKAAFYYWYKCLEEENLIE